MTAAFKISSFSNSKHFVGEKANCLIAIAAVAIVVAVDVAAAAAAVIVIVIVVVVVVVVVVVLLGGVIIKHWFLSYFCILGLSSLTRRN